MNARPGEGEPDSVWVTVEFPFPAPALREFLADTERLFRLHPHLDIHSWQVRPEGGFRVIGHHELSGAELHTTAQRRDDDPAAGFTLAYDEGLKRETVFRLTPCGDRTHVTATERYRPLAGSDDPRRNEIDSALTVWIVALRRHLVARRRWGKLPGWRGWNERFLPRMAPRQRRIVRLLVWVSALEFAAFLAAVLVLRAAS